MRTSLFSRFTDQARTANPQGYVHAFTINGLTDPFDADDLWAAPRMAFTSEPLRLRQALESRPERLQGRKVQQVFSQIQVLLPSATIVRDRRAARGASSMAMAARLRDLHREDFGEVAGPSPIRYQVLGSDEVPEGSVLVRFGLGIHVPSGAEKYCARGISGWQGVPPTDAASDLRCRLHVSVDGGVIFAPLADVYPDERLIVLGADTGHASHAVPSWPYSKELLLVVVNEPGMPLEVGAEPYGAMQVRAGNQPGDHVVTMPDIDSKEPPLVLRVIDDRPGTTVPLDARIGASSRAPQNLEARTGGVGASDTVPPSTVPATVDLKRALLPADDADKTYVASLARATHVNDPTSALTYVPQRRKPLPRFSLSGLVLQRVSQYAQVGVTGFHVGFDTALQLALEGRATWLRLDVDSLDHLTVITRSGQQALKLPALFAHRDDRLEVKPPPVGMETHCVGLVLRDFGVSEPIPTGMPLITGRGQRLLSSLRVLDGMGGIVKAGEQRATSDDQMGLSRRAFSMEVDNQTLKISQLAPTQRLFHMDQDLRLVSELDGAANDDAVLQPGHYLAASHYLWRFGVPGLD